MKTKPFGVGVILHGQESGQAETHRQTRATSRGVSAKSSEAPGRFDLRGKIIISIVQQQILNVRLQGFWDQERPNLRESLAHLVGFDYAVCWR